MADDRSFVSTGAWTSRQLATITASRANGTNTIKATASTGNGGPNLDSLTIGVDWSVAVVESTMDRFGSGSRPIPRATNAFYGLAPRPPPGPGGGLPIRSR